MSSRDLAQPSEEIVSRRELLMHGECILARRRVTSKWIGGASKSGSVGIRLDLSRYVRRQDS